MTFFGFVDDIWVQKNCWLKMKNVSHLDLVLGVCKKLQILHHEREYTFQQVDSAARTQYYAGFPAGGRGQTSPPFHPLQPAPTFPLQSTASNLTKTKKFKKRSNVFFITVFKHSKLTLKHWSKNLRCSINSFLLFHLAIFTLTEDDRLGEFFRLFDIKRLVLCIQVHIGIHIWLTKQRKLRVHRSLQIYIAESNIGHYYLQVDP